MIYSSDLIPVPGIQISIRMIDKDGAFIAIESDNDDEVISIYLPSKDLATFTEQINDALKLSDYECNS